MKIQKSPSVWMPEWLEELRAIIVEGVYNSRIDLIEMKWKIGEHIEARKEDIEPLKLIEKASQSLRVSRRDTYRCWQFYRKYPEKDFPTVLETLPEGKNISWHKVVNKLLPAPREKEHQHNYEQIKAWSCIECQQKIFSEPLPPEKTSRSAIIEIIQYLKEKMELKKLDRPHQENWDYAKRSIRKWGEKILKEIVDIGSRLSLIHI